MAVFSMLSSCTSNPVGWGGRYEVRLANEKTITIEYDRMMSSYEEILGVARTHCRKYGKVPIPADEDISSGTKGLVPTRTFHCE